ncbi:hypothetical protein OG2516_18010 [Oceanicola granulosus HTCC2516]|uniref:AMP-dependent synthetase/ligase domain-containing protein n=1 Tax=Oceanicola granulosus (strain ATCC BAA-861 / DSM 15982 / KCTC 12143 / HTCC2516) TaxID=314256 RepID=Q2CEP2_OCEGH|nr:fatty acid--CoA ligase family protein [Oceanicola granulosus]EAR51090.1 hypothetical protein OG2516_18010 [Oceanicola granulosus HTCC2516]
MLSEIIPFQAKHAPEAHAIELPTGTITYRRFAADIGRMAQALADEGIAPGQVVLVSDARPYIHLLRLMALLQLGCTSVSEERLRRTAGLVRPDWVLAETPPEDLPETTRVILQDAERLGRVLSAEPVPGPRPEVSAETLVRLDMTSGSTGQPKIVPLSLAMMVARLQNNGPLLPFPVRLLSTMGLDVTGSFLALLKVWSLGQTAVFAGPLSPGDALRQLKPTFAVMAPIQAQHLLSTWDASWPRPETFRLVTGGAPLPRRLRDALIATITDDIPVSYGSTEGWLICHGDAKALPDVPGATGYVLPGAALQIVDDADTPLPSGEIGRVRVRSGEMVAHYWTPEGQVPNPSFRDGWFYPGDLGQLTAEGLFVHSGRTDDVLNLGGEKVAAFEVEEQLAALPGVREAGAFALADASGVDCLHAAVVADRPASDITADFIARFRREIVVTALPHLPRTPFGKLERPTLVAQVRQALAES